MITLWEMHERVYVRGHTKGLRAQVIVETLAEKDIGLVINAAKIPHGQLWEASRLADFEYQHRHFPDSHVAVPEIAVKRAVVDLVAMLKRGRSVMTFCDQGRNRSALLAALAIQEVSGLEPAVILERMRKVRNIVLSNPTFERYFLTGGSDQKGLFG